MKKRLLSIVLAALMVISLLPVTAFAEEGSSEQELPIETLSISEASEGEASGEEVSEEELPVGEKPEEEVPVEELYGEETLSEEASEEPDGQILAVEGPIPYLVYENGEFVTRYCEDYTVRSTGSFNREETLTSGWYVLTGGSAGERITCSGDVKIILLNDADCYFRCGIGLHLGSKLSIFAQPAEEGKSVGQLRTGGFNGGNASTGYYTDDHTGGAGIGGDYYPGEDRNATCGEVYIYGGKLDIKGGNYSAGIGGAGDDDRDSTHVGNGGMVCIYGGEVKATGGRLAAGIGGGSADEDCGDGDRVYIFGGTVYAYGGDGAAGIGGGTKIDDNLFRSDVGTGGYGGIFEMYGGEVHAYGGNTSPMSSKENGGGAGIGGGQWGYGGAVSVYGGILEAVGGDRAAGIGGGGGEGSRGGIFSLNGGKVIVRGGDYGAAIGGGNKGAGGEVYLNNGELHATFGYETFAIGGGDNISDEGSVTVNKDSYLYYLSNNQRMLVNPDLRQINGNYYFLGKEYIHVALVSADLLKTDYLAYDAATKAFTLTTKEETVPVANKETMTMWVDRWYVVDRDLTVNDVITVSGKVSLILMNGCTLNAAGGIYVQTGSSLTVYAQSQDENGMGKLIATGASSCAGIGGIDANTPGAITINGGYIEANGGVMAAGIGGGNGGNGGTITVNGGEITATGGFHGAGIGGGERGSGGTVTVNGGEITATGGFYAAGIGGGERGVGGDITFAGGKVTAKGGNSAPGIGGGKSDNNTGGANLRIAGSCRVIAEAGANAPGAIGNGTGGTGLGTIEVVNGITMLNNKNGNIRLSSKSYTTDWSDFLSVTDTGVDFTAANGKATYYMMNGTRYDQNAILISSDAVIWSEPWYVISGECTIPYVEVDGNVNIILEDGCTLNVGGIHAPAGTTLTIYAQSQEETEMGQLISNGAENCAGIGSGEDEECGIITINGGYIEANGGHYAAGIGGGCDGEGGLVTVNGGIVVATGNDKGAGIGGGRNARGGNFIINGGVVTANGGDEAAGIGGGYWGFGGSATFAGGRVYARGGYGAAGIGGGNKNNGAYITISGDCTVKAEAGEDAPRAVGNGIRSDSLTSPGTISVSDGLIVTDNKTGATGRPGESFTTDWIGFLSGTSVDFTASSNKTTSYYVMDGERSGDLTCTVMTDDTVVWSDTWYVVSGDRTIPSATVSGHVNIILEDGCNLTVGGIVVPSNNTLTIYAQSQNKNEMGILIATGKDNCAGIGAGSYSAGGALTVNGGYVEATGGANGSGIGGGFSSRACYLEINDGEVVARGGSGASGIGGGKQGYANSVAIAGGTVTAKGGDGASAIGGGVNNGGVTISITGCCTVEAEAGKGAPYALGKGPNDPYLTTPGTVKIDSGIIPVDENGNPFERRIEGWMSVMNAERVFFRTVPDLDPEPELDAVSYLAYKYDEETDTYSFEDENCTDFDIVSGENTTLMHTSYNSGWYVVRDSGYFDQQITVSGDVNLILMDGQTLSADKGIYVPDGSSLTIYAQSTEESTRGRLIATGADNCAGIGGGGPITVNGGYVEATGGVNGSGLGGAYGGKCSVVTINAGEVFAQGGVNGAGVGGGCDGGGGVATINNGKVTAIGGDYGAGIGGGRGARGCNFIINDGEVTAKGGKGATGIGGGTSGIGGSITFAGGKVTAQGGDGASGIGGGDNYGGVNVVVAGSCTVEASAGKGASRAIGKGPNDMNLDLPGNIMVDIGIIVINNKTGDSRSSVKTVTTDWFEFLPGASVDFTAVNGMTSYYVENGTRYDQNGTVMSNDSVVWSNPWYVVSGECTISSVKVDGNVNLILEDGCILNVGGIHVPSGSSLTIYAQSKDENKMGRLVATGAENCAGIGGIDEKTPGKITVNGGYVEATGGVKGAGIGGGNNGSGGTVTINDGIVTANGGNFAAGIGGGYNGDGGSVTVSGGTVSANGKFYGAGIGGGDNGNGGTVTITGGDVEAKGGSSGAGIGGGDNGNGGSVTILGGNVEAKGGSSGAGIGSGYDGEGGNLTLNGGNVTAVGGEDAAGVGCGSGTPMRSGGTVTLSDGVLTAIGNGSAAGIGGGKAGDGANVRISGNGTLIAEAGENSPRAIGNGEGAPAFVKPGSIEVTVGIAVTDNKTGAIRTSGKSYTTEWLKVDFLSGASVDITASINETDSYYIKDGTRYDQKGTVMTDDAVCWSDTWYVVRGDCTIPSVTVKGNVNLILEDRCSLNVTDGIRVEDGSSLTVYAQSSIAGIRGKLEAVSSTDGYAGIGSGPNKSSGNITVYGGSVTGRGGKQAAGIGGGSNGTGTVTVYGGSVVGYGGANGGAGIGGGYNGAGAVTIHGGTVTGQSLKGGGAGIGGGYGTYGLCNILIEGGAVVSAEGGVDETDKTKAGPGIGSGLNGMFGSVGIRNAGIHAKGGSAIKASSILMEPDAGYAIKLTSLNDGKETFYPAKMTIPTLSGKSDIYIETVEKTTQMEEWPGPASGYNIIEGANSVWNCGSSEGLVITSDAPFAKFNSVKVDGCTIAETDYTAEEGSTRITLAPAYLETLSDGSHSIEIVSDDGVAFTFFTVKAAAQPSDAVTYTVTFNMGGHGTAPADQKVNEGCKAVKPAANPAADGYTFDGWYADEGLSVKFDFDSVITADTEIYAKWTKISGDEDSPQTGDNTRMFLWMALLCINCGIIAGTSAGRRRKKAE